MSSSINTFTLCSASLSIPSIVTAPFLRPKYFSKSSSLANVRGLSPKVFLNSFKLTLLSPLTNIK